MSHYDTTTLQTKTCGEIANLIKDVVDYLIKGKGDKLEILMRLNNFLRQHEISSELMYGGTGGVNRQKRRISKE